MISKKALQEVVFRKLEATSGTDLSSILAQASARSNVALKDLECLLDRCLDIASNHEAKELIYAEVGDAISDVRFQIEEIRAGLQVISYASSKLEEKRLKSQIPSRIRDQIDVSVKRDK